MFPILCEGQQGMNKSISCCIGMNQKLNSGVSAMGVNNFKLQT